MRACNQLCIRSKFLLRSDHAGLTLSNGADLRTCTRSNFFKGKSWKLHCNVKRSLRFNVSSCTNSKRELECDSHESRGTREEDESMGVKVALSMLNFYRREISPILPKSCRYVPSCSEYSIIAYKRYGVLKGTILTGWRLCRCNPLGGSGFDPPRWFGEEAPPSE